MNIYRSKHLDKKQILQSIIQRLYLHEVQHAEIYLYLFLLHHWELWEDIQAYHSPQGDWISQLQVHKYFAKSIIMGWILLPQNSYFEALKSPQYLRMWPYLEIGWLSL